jgi:hypothetical protein
LFIFSSAALRGQPTVKLLSQMAAHLRTGSPLLAGESAGFKPRTVGLQSGVVTNEPPLLPNEPPLLPNEPPLLSNEPPLLPNEPPLLHHTREHHCPSECGDLLGWTDHNQG